jgi:hypothetical protein
MIHVTFQNDETALYREREHVWICKNIIDGEYICNDRHVEARDLLDLATDYGYRGGYVLKGADENVQAMVNSPIKSVRIL